MDGRVAGGFKEVGLRLVCCGCKCVVRWVFQGVSEGGNDVFSQGRIWTGRAFRVVGVSAAVGLLGATSCVVVSGPCAEEDSEETIDVSGIFRYAPGDFLDLNVPPLTGTITFAQEGNTVRVLDTAYDLGSDRALEGEADLVGNTLMIRLVPKNGDADYTADITFVFSNGGSEFCVLFTDTNGDEGGMGSFVGRRIGD